jgi:hypothetical protein
MARAWIFGLLFSLLFWHGCALATDRLRWQVASADRVALERVERTKGFWERYDLAHPVEVLPADKTPRTAEVPNRTGVVARRNPDGSIDLEATDGVLKVVAADGTVTALDEESSQMPANGNAAAFVTKPLHFAGRAPLRLRLVTPRENVVDARILVRRDPLSGGVLVGFGALAIAFGSTAIALDVPGARAHDRGADALIGFGSLALSAGVYAIGAGLYHLLLYEHDRHLTTGAR